jgi:alanyl-tRNA synthetase
MNPLNKKTINILDSLSLDDLRRKVNEIVEWCNETNKRIEKLEAQREYKNIIPNDTEYESVSMGNVYVEYPKNPIKSQEKDTEWADEFDEKFPSILVAVLSTDINPTPENQKEKVKAFIKSTLQSQKEKLIKDIIEWAKENQELKGKNIAEPFVYYFDLIKFLSILNKHL